MTVVQPTVRHFVSYEVNLEVNKFEVVKGVSFNIDLVKTTFSGRQSLIGFSVMQGNSALLPSWLRYDANKGLLSGLWPGNDKTVRLALTLKPTGSELQLSFELIASGSSCALQPVIRVFPDVRVFAMAHDAQETLWLAGGITRDAANKDLFLARLSSSGELLSARRFGGVAFDAAYSLAFDSAGAAWLAGETSSFGAVNGSDALIAQFSSMGGLMKALRWGGEFDDSANALTIGANNSIWVAGFSGGFNGSSNSSFLIKLASDGTLDRVLSINSTLTKTSHSLVADSLGSVWLAADTVVETVNASETSSILLTQFSQSGELTQALRWGSELDDHVSALALDEQGSLYLAGSTKGLNATQSDALIAQFSADGNLTAALSWGVRLMMRLKP